jgi:hypothetical protein
LQRVLGLGVVAQHAARDAIERLVVGAHDGGEGGVVARRGARGQHRVRQAGRFETFHRHVPPVRLDGGCAPSVPGESG